jgi:hypothetical protein
VPQLKQIKEAQNIFTSVSQLLNKNHLEANIRGLLDHENYTQTELKASLITTDPEQSLDLNELLADVNNQMD